MRFIPPRNLMTLSIELPTEDEIVCLFKSRFAFIIVLRISPLEKLASSAQGLSNAEVTLVAQ